MIDFVPKLAESLAPTYRLDRELGGGGMSRVFLAEEPRLARRVVVKVLPPETSAGIPADRFEREIRVAASLQHPHLVPVLSAGGFSGIVYYVMPFIDGESLAERLLRDGALPVDEAVRILREVADALAFAHERGVVHRDVKPDNILLSGRHALITDFGVAKAVTDAAGAGAGKLTGAGIALGTPTYMAPEQAAADGTLDHRADVYALGVVAYEMLSGRPPFTAPTPQGLIAAHVTLAPDPVARYRPGIPAELAAVVMRCLEKHPADRWQSADELLAQIDLATRATPAGGLAATVALPVATAPRMGRVLLLFALATAVVTLTAFALSRVAGLPDWVWLAALGCMLVGLPIILYTGRTERSRAEARATGSYRASGERGARRWFTWRRALLGGAAALGLLGVLTAGYAVSRGLGVGPGATLLSSGALASRDQLVLADFTNRTRDSTLGATVTEALRVDLGQSRVVRLLDVQQVSTARRRMDVPDTLGLGESLAREIALREGAKAVVVGEVSELGKGYVLTARVISADSGATLSPVRVTAASDADLIGAVNRLSAELRERVGESLKAIRASEPLERVTTASLPALRLYTDGVRAFSAGQYVMAREQLERATTVDSAFAMAWRKLGATYFNLGAPRALRIEAARQAFRHRDRLPPLERHLTDAYYYTDADRRPNQAIAAYRAALEIAPTDFPALNNLGMLLGREGRFSEGEAVLRKGIEAQGPMTLFTNLNYALLSQGRFAAVDSLLRLAEERAPAGHRVPAQIRLDAALARRDYVTAESLVAANEKTGRRGALDRGTLFLRADLEERRGHLSRSRAVLAEIGDSAAAGGDRELAAALALTPVMHGLTRGEPAAARAALARVLDGPAFSGLGDSTLPVWALAEVYANLGDPAGVRRMHRILLATQPPESFGPSTPFAWAAMEAEAEQRWRDAAASYGRVADLQFCSPCGEFYAARMWDRAGASDSAIAHYRRGVETPVTGEEAEDAIYYPLALRRLGALYEERGDNRAALAWYGRFLDLWKDADPELQPIVRGVRDRVGALTAEPRR